MCSHSPHEGQRPAAAAGHVPALAPAGGTCAAVRRLHRWAGEDGPDACAEGAHTCLTNTLSEDWHRGLALPMHALEVSAGRDTLI